MTDGRTGFASRLPVTTAPSLPVWLTGLAVLLLLGAGLPLLVVTGSRPPGVSTYAVVLLWTLCVLTAARLAEFVIRRRAALLRLAFYVFCYVFLGISALAQVAAAHFPLSGREADAGTVARAATLFVAGFLAHEVGYLVGGRRADRGRATAESAPTRALPVVLNLRVVLLFCGLGVLTTVVAVYLGGLAPFFTSREAAGAAAFGSDLGAQAYAIEGKALGLLWSRAFHMLPFVGLFLLLHLLRRDPARRAPGYQVLAAVLAICNLIVNNPIGNSRLWAGIVAFGFLSVFVDLRRSRAVLWTALGMTGAFVAVFPFADAFRRTGSSGLSFGNPLDALTTSGSFSAFQTGLSGLQYVDDHGLTWGMQLAGGLLTLFPRALWPGKPVDTGTLIDPVYNRAATFWTEMHVNFGLVGVVAGLFLLGLAVRHLDDGFVAGRSWTLMAVPVLSPFYFILLRGTLSAAVGTLVPLAFLFWLGTRRGTTVGGAAPAAEPRRVPVEHRPLALAQGRRATG